MQQNSSSDSDLPDIMPPKKVARKSLKRKKHSTSQENLETIAKNLTDNHSLHTDQIITVATNKVSTVINQDISKSEVFCGLVNDVSDIKKAVAILSRDMKGINFQLNDVYLTLFCNNHIVHFSLYRL